MNVCQSKTDGVCIQAATWKQSVHAGAGETGRFLYDTYWCDDHAKRIEAHRKLNWVAPARMTAIEPEPVDAT